MDDEPFEASQDRGKKVQCRSGLEEKSSNKRGTPCSRVGGETISFCSRQQEVLEAYFHIDPVPTSEETHYVSATQTNRLMLFGETVAVYCESRMKHTDIVRTSQETHYVSATEPNRLTLFTEILALYSGTSMIAALLSFNKIQNCFPSTVTVIFISHLSTPFQYSSSFRVRYCTPQFPVP
jgi:hypothetical protein